MNKPVAIDKAEATSKPRSRFAFLLRPAFFIPLTIFTILVAVPLGYRTSRLVSVPPIAEIVDLEAEDRFEIEPEQNAFTFYKRAWKLAPPALDKEVVEKAVNLLEAEDRLAPEAGDVLDQSEAMLAEWKRGTELERGLRLPLSELNWMNAIDSVSAGTTCSLVALASARALHEGRPDEAWQWLRALLRFSRHPGNPGFGYDRVLGVSYHLRACKSLVRWAASNDVSTELLEAALIDVRNIDRLTISNSASLKSSYLTTMNILSTRKWMDLFGRSLPGTEELPDQFLGTYYFVVAEPEVSRMLLRHCYANLLSQCDLPRWERSMAASRSGLFQPTGSENPALLDPALLFYLLGRSELASILFPSVSFCDYRDAERSRQLALELCFSVELFRRRHGEYPESLEALVPEFLDEVPRDVYGSHPTDRMLMSLREPTTGIVDDPPRLPGLIIYSRGGNGNDDAGNIEGLIDIGLRIPLPQAEPK